MAEAAGAAEMPPAAVPNPWSPEVVKVAIIGGGYLGSRIAAELALCGCAVRIYDRSLRERVVGGVKSALLELERVGHLVGEGMGESGAHGHGGQASAHDLRSAGGREALARVTACDTLADAARGCNLLSEAVVDDPGVKGQVFKEVSQVCAEDAVLTTNSLNVTLDEIKAQLDTQWAQRVLGLRFLSPVMFIPLLEVTYAAGTQMTEMRQVASMMECLGKIVFDCPIMDQALRLSADAAAMQQQADRPYHAPPYLAHSRLRLRETEWRHHQRREARRFALRRAAAAAAASPADGGGGAAMPVDEEEEENCVVCLTAPREAMSISCGHTVMCLECATKVKMISSSCPFCRMRMREVVITKQHSRETAGDRE